MMAWRGRGSEKYLFSGCILKIQPTGFADRLDVGCEVQRCLEASCMSGSSGLFQAQELELNWKNLEY